ncbi:MAG: hypothetical protein CL623_03790 [Arcobacter sp.]|nr:hypothetical protein [Arcobacter sp.]|tara:strand:- start:3410 stop:3967 length:558 start_codon:yes stop_codon:yes gene_type:complete
MKRNYWPLLFIGIFSFTLGMIIWTVMSAIKLPVNEDKSFLKSYQDVDANYNAIMISNQVFLNKYDFNLNINKKTFGLTTDDIKYSQRVLEKKSQHKDILKYGLNDISLIVRDKNTNEKKSVKIALKVTKSISNKFDILLTNENFKNNENLYSSNFELSDKNNWNITGTFEVDGITGSIFIKTNAI